MQRILLVASIFGALGVAIGAFGAHGLQATLEANGRLETFKTGVLYHLIHALAILGVALIMPHIESDLLTYAAYAFVAGILLFSGSLYVLSIFNIGIMGAIAPLGGTAFIIGWILIGVAAWQSGI